MITFTDFLPVPEPQLTKVKFNMRSGDGSGEALEFLMDDHERWLNFGRWRQLRHFARTYFAEQPSS